MDFFKLGLFLSISVCATRSIVLRKQAELSLGLTKISTRHVHSTFFSVCSSDDTYSKVENNSPSRFRSKNCVPCPRELKSCMQNS